jgi:hypothetical protein
MSWSCQTSWSWTFGVSLIFGTMFLKVSLGYLRIVRAIGIPWMVDPWPMSCSIWGRSLAYVRNTYLVILCTSFACAKWRRPLGGSSWKLLELTTVSRFLAYVTRPHDWRIRVARGIVKPRWGKKSKYEPGLQKKTLQERMKIASLSDFVFTYISIICSMVKCKCLWRGRLVWSVLPTCLSTLLSQDLFDLLPRETLIVLSYKCCDSPSITSIQTEYLCGVKDLWSL